jgi:predicted ATP-dependent endonuclease of OLD family
MISTLKINGFRGFKEFEMNDLGRVNLLVGSNNGGKTSVLEALYLLETEGSMSALQQSLIARGEIADDGLISLLSIFHGSGSSPQSLFIGRKPEEQPRFRIESDQSFLEYRLFHFNDADSATQSQISESGIFNRTFLFFADNPLVLAAYNEGDSPKRLFPIRSDIKGQVVEQFDVPFDIKFVSYREFNIDSLIHLWDSAVDATLEWIVLNMLEDFYPGIKKIQAVSTNKTFLIDFDGKRVPLSSMGDGVKNLLFLACTLVQCSKGTLLIDEIDTGLHYSVQAKLWQNIIKYSKKLDIQVFASTHSYDCIRALSDVIEAEGVDPENPVVVHRIDHGEAKSVVFKENNIRIAIEDDIEMRGVL